MLAGCSGDKPVRGDVGFIEGFFGAVVADEPRAAEAGRDVLTSGGNAADAAVAMYFTMAATLPSAASLGSGGVCLVHDVRRRVQEAIVFPLTPVTGTRGYDISVPMSVRGMALLHARHGRARWEVVVANGERLARFGAPVSRVLSRDLQAGARLLGADPEARRVYDRGGGVAVSEGDIFRQGDLGAMLGAIKSRGGGDLFQGPLARQVTEAVQQAGGGLTMQHMREAVPRAVPALQVRFGDHMAAFAPPPFSGGQAAAAAFEGQGGGGGGAIGGGEAGIVAVDRDGNAVSCVFTMNQLFGARRVAPGTGVMLAAASGPGMSQATPILVSNVNNGEFLLAGAASGGAGAPAALGMASRTVLQNHGQLSDAVAGTSGGVLSIFTCSRGLKLDRRLCQAIADPRGNGLALVADK